MLRLSLYQTAAYRLVQLVPFGPMVRTEVTR